MTDPEIVDLSSKKNTFPFGSDMARNRVPFLAALTIDWRQFRFRIGGANVPAGVDCIEGEGRATDFGARAVDALRSLSLLQIARTRLPCHASDTVY